MTRALARLFVACLAVMIANCAAEAAPTTAVPPLSADPEVPGLGGHFALKSPDGREITEASFPGKWLLIYFGYTGCPDECPTALNAVATALADLGPLAAKIQPIFVTVDPKRDTPQVLANYLTAFDPRILGLYGSAEEIASAVKTFHVYYAVRPLGNGEYAIDHSSYIYLVNPQQRVVQLLAGNLPGHPIAAALRQQLR